MDELFPEATKDEILAAYRLSGQALVAWLHGVVIRYLRIGSGGIEKSAMELPPIGDPITVSQNVALVTAQIMLAGIIAVDGYRFGRGSGVRCVNFFEVLPALDRETYQEAMRLSNYAYKGTHPDCRPNLWSSTEMIISLPRHWAAIETLANTLLLDRELMGCEITDIIRHAAATYEPTTNVDHS